MEDICGYQIFIIVTDTNNSKDKYKYKLFFVHANKFGSDNVSNLNAINMVDEFGWDQNQNLAHE